MKIEEQQLEILCYAFHKWFRVADCKGDIEMWKAIKNLDGAYRQAMTDALKEAGIHIKEDKKKRYTTFVKIGNTKPGGFS